MKHGNYETPAWANPQRLDGSSQNLLACLKRKNSLFIDVVKTKIYQSSLSLKLRPKSKTKDY